MGCARTPVAMATKDGGYMRRGRDVAPEVQAFTLADPELRELLLPAHDPADSGIDSDATDSERRGRRQARQNEDSVDEESDVTVEIEMPVPYCAQHPNRSFAERSVRVSPSLFEIELTASDEDDVSVLELIIPYQQPRYQKLPTSSPLKTKVRAPRYLWGFLCCFRK
ncbi:uncharacterized protein LOC134672228 [Cydia fagiglandana]|uniref:uncharacterized protein LOC134672228 n=1 Tax=Cydia fagiglandana TaxID=1458189 RepID=UPI002FEDFE4F